MKAYFGQPLSFGRSYFALDILKVVYMTDNKKAPHIMQGAWFVQLGVTMCYSSSSRISNNASPSGYVSAIATPRILRVLSK